MAYFDLTANGHMLRKATRENDDVEAIVAKAEYDVFDYYRKIEPNTLGSPLQGATRIRTGLQNLTIQGDAPTVMLRYYKADPTLLTTDTELAFKEAVQRTIAALVELRVEQSSREPGVKMERRGRRTIEYFENSTAPEHSVPKSVRRYLAKYDIRMPV